MRRNPAVHRGSATNRSPYVGIRRSSRGKPRACSARQGLDDEFGRIRVPAWRRNSRVDPAANGAACGAPQANLEGGGGHRLLAAKRAYELFSVCTLLARFAATFELDQGAVWAEACSLRPPSRAADFPRHLDRLGVAAAGSCRSLCSGSCEPGAGENSQAVGKRLPDEA